MLKKTLLIAAVGIAGWQAQQAHGLTWDATAGNGTLEEGAGTWNTSSSNWTDDLGAANTTWVNSPLQDAVFGDASGSGTPGDILVGDNISATSVTLLKSGYKLTFQNDKTLSVLNTITINSGTSIENRHGVISTGTLEVKPGGSYIHAEGGSIPSASLTAGVVNQTGGTANFFQSALTMDPGAIGTYNLSGGTLEGSGSYAVVGRTGTATFTQTGGINGLDQGVKLGYDSGAVGTYDLSGGELTHGAVVGYSGSGTFNHTGGTNNGACSLGSEGGSTGVYNLSGTGAIIGELSYVGDAGTGTFNQTGGTHSLERGGILYLGYQAGSTGTYGLAGGTLTADFAQDIGVVGTGTFNQSGGSNTIGILSQPQFGGYLVLGDAQGSTGAYNLSGGSLAAVTEHIGLQGAGTFTHSGGTNTAGKIYLGIDVDSGLTSGSGRYELAGLGTLTAGALEIGPGSNFNQSGGAVEITDTTTVRRGGLVTVIMGSFVSGAVTNDGTITQSRGVVHVGPVTGGGSVIVQPDASFVAQQVRQNSLTINGNAQSPFSKVLINNDGDASDPDLKLNVLTSLKMNNDNAGWDYHSSRDYYSTLDLQNNDLVVRAAAGTGQSVWQNDILPAIVAGFNFGKYDNRGITSSTAQHDGNTVLAAIINDDGQGNLLFGYGSEIGSSSGQTEFSGLGDLTTDDIIIKYTYYGDLDLNGAVDWFDQVLLEQFFGTLNSGWLFGDVSYDGRVDAIDQALLDINFGLGSGGGFGDPLGDSGSVTVTPEPASLVLLAFGALVLARRPRQPPPRP